LNQAGHSRYIVKQILGLDADEIIPRFYGFSKDGTKRFYDFRLKPKDLVMRVVLNPRFSLNETNSNIRDELYKAIAPTRTGQLEIQFHSGGTTPARLYGHITKVEVPYFSQIPELQITIRCDDPMFRGLTPVVLDATDLGSANPVIIADSSSTAPHGLALKMTLTASLATFIIQDKASSPTWKFEVVPATTFLTGDEIYLSTEFTNRYLYRIRSGVTLHLLDKIDPEDSVWPIIFPGENPLYFPGMASLDWNYLQFLPAYWGV
jgi:hypothetical protein